MLMVAARLIMIATIISIAQMTFATSLLENAGMNQLFAMMETCAQAMFVLKQMENVFLQIFLQLCVMIKTNALVTLAIARPVNVLIRQRIVMMVRNF